MANTRQRHNERKKALSQPRVLSAHIAARIQHWVPTDSVPVQALRRENENEPTEGSSISSIATTGSVVRSVTDRVAGRELFVSHQLAI